MHDNGVICLRYTSGSAMKNTLSKAKVSYFRQGHRKSHSNEPIQSEVKYLLFGVRKGQVLLTHQMWNVHVQIEQLLIHCSKNGSKLFGTKKKKMF